MEKTTNYRGLGMAFMAMGVSLSVSFALTLGPAFMGIGVAFFVLGLVFLNKDKGGGQSDG